MFSFYNFKIVVFASYVRFDIMARRAAFSSFNYAIVYINSNHLRGLALLVGVHLLFSFNDNNVYSYINEYVNYIMLNRIYE